MWDERFVHATKPVSQFLLHSFQGGCAASTRVYCVWFPVCSGAASLPTELAGVWLKSAPKTAHSSFLKHGRYNFSRHLWQTSVAFVTNGVHCEMST